jgi:hypothetical protein
LGDTSRVVDLARKTRNIIIRIWPKAVSQPNQPGVDANQSHELWTDIIHALDRSLHSFGEFVDFWFPGVKIRKIAWGERGLTQGWENTPKFQ